MKIKVLTVSDNIPATKQLVYTLEHNGWDYQVLETPFRGFGTKLITTYNFLKSNPDVTEFIFVDAFDVVALGTPQEFETKKQEYFGDAEIIVGTEKGCWPIEDYRRFYEPQHEHGFNFVNSGLYYAKSASFIRLMEASEVLYSTDDQQFFTEAYLFDEQSGIKLDTDQVLFNNHSFIAEGEYGYENGRIQILGNEPCFIHSNGRTADPKLDELINKI